MTDEERTWSIDLSELTGADVPTIIAADNGNIPAQAALLEKTIRPDVESVPLTEWHTAKKEMMDKIISTMFPREKAG